jgi:predicted DNA-binding transcriptional regulator YafY
MNTSEISLRQQLILNKLRIGMFSFSEILSYLELESEIQSLDFNISLRTFQREIKHIATIYGIEIVYDRSSKKYKIIAEDFSIIQLRMLEAFDVYTTIYNENKVADTLIFDSRKPQGTEYLKTVLNAIKSNFSIEFEYHYFKDNSIIKKHIEPIALKENRQRWYLVGFDLDKNTERIYALDRMKKINVKREVSKRNNINVCKLYENSFGIIAPNSKPPIDIELTFSPFQAKYIKTLPLHHSQFIKNDGSEKVVFGLFIVPTLDFNMELLSYGGNLLDIKPQSYKNEILELHKKAVENLL